MRCRRCVLSNRTPSIVFDDDGICNYCRSYKKINYLGEKRLFDKLKTLKKRNGKYDCMVGISGGRDSSYVLLKLVKDYKMKVLGINYENPFTVPEAKENIEKAAKILDVDIISFKDEKRRHERFLRSALQAWVRKPSAALIPVICLGCKPAWLKIYKYAKRYDIPAILTGGNPYEIITFKREIVGIDREEVNETAFFRYIYSLKEFIKNPAYLKGPLIKIGIKSYFFGSPYSLGLRVYKNRISWLQLFDYIKWNEKEIIKRLKNELDWRYPNKLNSTWRFDCRVKHLVDYLYMKTLKMTDKEEFYSKMVREGQISRDEGIEKIKKEEKIHIDEVEMVLYKVGINPSIIYNAF